MIDKLFFLTYYSYKWRIDPFRNQQELDGNHTFVKKVQFQTFPNNAPVWFDYDQSVLQNDFADLFVFVLVDGFLVPLG